MFNNICSLQFDYTVIHIHQQMHTIYIKSKIMFTLKLTWTKTETMVIC